ncbi:MAG: LCP family protein, partial [Chloroflexota bacterium]|nr:LCP family protein [Chloroflexota bacterium]
MDPAAHSAHLLSIPGNLWVTIPGYGQSTISQAYADGGPRLSLLTVESVTHVAIPYYVVVREGALRSLIDALGGVTLDIPAGLHVRHVTEGGKLVTSSRLPNGRQRVNGTLALEYQHATTAQPNRPVDQFIPQQSLMAALVAQGLTAQNLFRIPSLVTTLGGSFPTNFPYDQVPALARTLSTIPRARIFGTSLSPQDRAVTENGAGSAGVLLPDWYQIRRVARTTFPQPDLEAQPGVEVLNGSG